MDKIKELYYSCYFLTAFKFLKEDKVFISFLNLLKMIFKSSDFEENISAYSGFIRELYEKKYDNFSKYLSLSIRSEKPSELYEGYDLTKEINVINSLALVECGTLKSVLKKKFPNEKIFIENMPEFKTSELNELHTGKIENRFLDVYENNNAFIFDNDFEIKPVEIFENIKFSDLKGYTEQKKVLYENTYAFLKGTKVNNILLYGDAGCGKSSSVRALLNEFKEIKIVQIFKNNLINLDKLYKQLQDLPYKFIIFADDITFDDSDENFSTMKAILEGSLIQCPKNAVIYATSNRKHLVRESFRARSGDEVHLNDTINEITSLSERFGINLLFQKPTNEEYLNIVLELAKDNNIKMDENCLIEKAKKASIVKGTRSPRVAKQLIDNILAYVNV